MVVCVHVDGHHIDHNLSNQNVNRDQHDEGQWEAVVPDQVLYGLIRKEDGLLVDHESVQEHNTTSQKSISREEEAVLVVRQDILVDLSKDDVKQDNQCRWLSYRVLYELLDGQDDLVEVWHQERSVLQQGNGCNDDNDRIKEHTNLIENEQAWHVVKGFCGHKVPNLLFSLIVIKDLKSLRDPRQEHIDEVDLL